MFLNKLINKGYEAEQCQICNTKFNLMKLGRIHKCKRCNKYICWKCGKDKEMILDKDGKWTKQPHRICALCKDDFLEIHDTIKKCDMHWNRNTTMAKEWLQNMSREKPKDFEYNHYLKLFNKNLKKFAEEVEIIDKDVVKGRTDSAVFNFSMREFFYTVKMEVDNQDSRQNIRNVLYAIAARYDKIGYCQGMSGVAAFLLCFSSESLAFTIFCDLLENVYPNDFFRTSQYGISLSGLLAETHFLQEYFIHFLVNQKKPLLQKVRGQFYSESELNHFRTIIELVGSKALLSLFVGIVSFSNCIFIWQEIKEHRSFEVIQKAFIAIIYLNREKIQQNRSYKVLQEIFERMKLEEFKEFYYDVQINSNVRNNILKQYHEGVNKKWNSKSDHQLKVLPRVTAFSIEQVMTLKKHFLEDQKGIAISKQKFIQIVACFYQVLKSQSPQDILLQTNEVFVKQIFDSYDFERKGGLDFRQFALALSICTKSPVKERVRAIISTFKNSQGIISVNQFVGVMKNLSLVSSQDLQKEKAAFFNRIEKVCNESEYLNFSEFQILLNDEFINALSFCVKSECPKNIEKAIYLFQQKQ